MYTQTPESKLMFVQTSSNRSISAKSKIWVFAVEAQWSLWVQSSGIATGRSETLAYKLRMFRFRL